MKIRMIRTKVSHAQKHVPFTDEELRTCANDALVEMKNVRPGCPRNAAGNAFSSNLIASIRAAAPTHGGRSHVIDGVEGVMFQALNAFVTVASGKIENGRWVTTHKRRICAQRLADGNKQLVLFDSAKPQHKRRQTVAVDGFMTVWYILYLVDNKREHVRLLVGTPTESKDGRFVTFSNTHELNFNFSSSDAEVTKQSELQPVEQLIAVSRKDSKG